MAARVRLDHGGIAAVLKSAKVASIVATSADAVAANATGYSTATGEPIPVTVTSGTTDRAISSVALAHPAGIRVEAKHAVLVRAAGAAGLEVTARSA